MWLALAKLLVGEFVPYLKEVATRKSKIEEAKVEVVISKAQQEFELNKLAVNDWGRSWKDEYLLLILSAPIIGIFIPPLKPYIYEGFNSLNAMPDWYVGLFVSISLAVYGLRGVAQFRKPTMSGNTDG